MISLIKLIDGTEIIGNVGDAEDTVSVSNPLQVNYYMRNPANPPVISLFRYMPLSSTVDFNFSRSHIIAITEPMPGMVGYYNATLKDICEYMDETLNNELMEKAGELTFNEANQDVLEALVERALKKPLLN